MAVARRRPPAATTVGRPRRSGEPSSTSSWTSVAPWTSSTATAAPHQPVGLGRRGARREEHQQRTQALAAGGDRVARVARRARGPWPVGELGHALLDAVHQPRRRLAAGVDDRLDRRGSSRRHLPDVQRDDAAGGEHVADPVAARSAHITAASSSGPGTA